MVENIEYRVYYDMDGSIITYTTEKLPGDYIIITQNQFAEARSDARVINDKLIMPHKTKVAFKMVKNLSSGVKTSKYDINVLTDIDYVYWGIEQNVIKG